MSLNVIRLTTPDVRPQAVAVDHIAGVTSDGSTSVHLLSGLAVRCSESVSDVKSLLFESDPDAWLSFYVSVRSGEEVVRRTCVQALVVAPEDKGTIIGLDSEIFGFEGRLSTEPFDDLLERLVG